MSTPLAGDAKQVTALEIDAGLAHAYAREKRAVKCVGEREIAQFGIARVADAYIGIGKVEEVHIPRLECGIYSVGPHRRVSANAVRHNGC